MVSNSVVVDFEPPTQLVKHDYINPAPQIAQLSSGQEPNPPSR